VTRFCASEILAHDEPEEEAAAVGLCVVSGFGAWYYCHYFELGRRIGGSRRGVDEVEGWSFVFLFLSSKHQKGFSSKSYSSVSGAEWIRCQLAYPCLQVNSFSSLR